MDRDRVDPRQKQSALHIMKGPSEEPEDCAGDNRGTKQPGRRAYAGSLEYLLDELKRLDLRIRMQLLKQRNGQPSSPLDQFKGLVLSEGEIAGLLTDLATPPADEVSDSEYQTLSTALAQIETEIEERRAASSRKGIYISLAHLAQLFQLTRFEQQCLLICLAPEFDHKYEKLYAYLQDDVTRKKPSVSLMMSLLLSAMEEKLSARSVFDPHAPLLRFRLLQILDSSPEGPTPLLSRFLKLDDRMVDFLLGSGQMDGRLEQTAKLAHPEAYFDQVMVEDEEQDRIRRFVRSHFNGGGSARENVLFYIYGPYGSGKRAFAETVARDLGLHLIIADVAKMLEGALPFEEAMWLLGREGLLQPAILCLENIDCLLADDASSKSRLETLVEVTRACCWLAFLFGSRPWKPHGLLNQSLFIDLHLSIPDDASRKRLWMSLSSQHQFGSDVDLGALASKFRFTQGQIQDALVAAQNLARLRPPERSQITMTDLHAACRAHSSQKLNNLARKIEPTYTWEDIVLPEEVLGQLREVCQRVVYRHRVMGDWGFGKKLSLGKGVNALFAGPSGTGKTMASEIVSRELDLDLYKIDLSGVVSKYIGETEKNLDRIFSAAEDANAILFFDEADALFGKRSEVRDSHDRYANIEISYLLQKMEEYEGLAILATNLKANLDESFTRRLAFTIHFPFPDEANRRRIWRGIWPVQIELDKSVDLDFLAGRFKLSGGNIKNIALAAAFLAASDGGRVTMSHLLHATRREYQKLGKPLGADELMPNVVEEVSL